MVTDGRFARLAKGGKRLPETGLGAGELWHRNVPMASRTCTAAARHASNCDCSIGTPTRRRLTIVAAVSYAAGRKTFANCGLGGGAEAMETALWFIQTFDEAASSESVC